jgi:hypothetical protein
VYVDVDYNGSFTKTGGVIYGASAGANSNTVKIDGVVQTNGGAAVWAPSYARNTTVSEGQNLSVTSDGVYTGQWTD